MKKVRKRLNKQLHITNILLHTVDYLSTEQICNRADCDRKTVYKVLTELEVCGFVVDKQKKIGKKGRPINCYNILGY